MLRLKEFIPIGIGIEFWLQWVCATVGGFLMSLYWIEVGFRSDMRLVQGVIGGFVIGIAQWLVLRRQLPHVGWWVIATTLAWGVIGYSQLRALGWVAPKGMDSVPLRSLYGMLDGLKVGALLSAFQWFVVRRQVPNGFWWIGTNAVVWALGLAIAWTSGALLRLKTGLFLGEVVGLSLGWGAIAALTGAYLAVLLPDTSAKKP